MSDRLEGKPCRNDQSPEIPRSDSHQDIYRNSCLASETKVGRPKVQFFAGLVFLRVIRP